MAVSSRTLEKAREKAAQWDVPAAYGSHAELLQDKTVNIVYISNVNTGHYAHVTTSAQREAANTMGSVLAGAAQIC